jgi:voltage-gated potassium channel Kch
MGKTNKGKGNSTFLGGKSSALNRMWREERYTILLASVFVYIILSVILPQRAWSQILIDVIFFILVLSVVFETARFRSIYSLLGFLGLLATLGHIISYLWAGTPLSRSILAVSSILFMTAAIHRVSRRVLGSKVVTGDTIRGAIIIYLFIGTLFSSIYILIEIIFPGSFLITNTAGKPITISLEDISRLFGYFSFVTLTTLGYGDIIPIKDLSRTMAWIEAFTGQIYLAVIIARLVGMYIVQSNKSGS